MTTKRLIREPADNGVRTEMPNTANTFIVRPLRHSRAPSPRRFCAGMKREAPGIGLLSAMYALIITAGCALASIAQTAGAVSTSRRARQTALRVAPTPFEDIRPSRAKHLAASLRVLVRSWLPLASGLPSTARRRGMNRGTGSKQRFGLLVPLLGAWLVLFQPSVHASSDKALTALMSKAERMAERDVLSPSDMAIFDAIGSIPFLGFITPMNVMSPDVRDRIRQRTAEIIRSELEHVERGQSPQLQATSAQLGTALQSVSAIRRTEKAPDSDLAQFSQYIRASNLLPGDNNGGPISLYQASLLLERWGIDPYDFEAHPYYCALGIKAIASMNVHTTRFCS